MWDIFRKTWLSLRHAGSARTAQRALQRAVPAWLFDFNSLIAIKIDFEDLHLIPAIEEWPYRWANKGDLELLTQGGFSVDELRAFWDLDGRAALCTKDGKLVGYTWYLTKSPTVFGWIRVALNGEVYGAAGYVAPEFRGRRIQSQARKFAYTALADLGYTRAVSFIEHFNRSSMRAGSNSIRRYIGRLSYVRLLGLVIYRIDARWGAGLWNSKRPFDLSFDDFDRENFRLKHKHARTGLDGQ